MADVMTGVPSIVMGLFIYTSGTLHFGYSGFAGALALACLMLPVVIRSTEEMLRLVPDELREGSYALGATKARVTLTVVLPAALARHRQRLRCSPSPAPPARRRRCCSRSAPSSTTTRTSSAAPNTALSSQIFAQRDVAVRRRPGPRLGRGADARSSSRSSLTLVARIVTARFASSDAR